MRVLLLSEGNSDVRLGDPELPRGAVRVLLRRIIENRIGRPLADSDIEGGRLPRLQQGSGFERKAKLAILQHDSTEIELLAIVIDRDGPANRTRLQLLQNGKSGAMQDGAALANRTALGVAVEMVEAWLLADTAALATTVNATGSQPDPETIPNPKAVLNDLIRSAGQNHPRIYDQIAGSAALQEIRKRCSAFDGFVREVQQSLNA